jgi:PAS domain S-box-containing protein
MERNEHPPFPLLLVDDTPANLVALKAILNLPAYRLWTASSGEEALRIAERQEIGIILLDVVMPVMDGFEVAARLKAMPEKRLIPILFLTAVATDINYVYRAYDVGAVDYLVKPLDTDMVRKKVAVFAELVRQREQIERHGEELRELQRREYELRIAELRIAGDRRYRKLVDGIDHAIAWTADESLGLTFVSRQASMILGYPLAEFLAPDFWAEHIHPEDRESVLALFRRALAEGCDLVCNHRIVASDGRTLWFHTGVSGERGIAVPAELHGFSVDVTDLKHAEERARRATQARDDLLAIVSHDLRNPLNSIKLSAGMLGREIANPEDAPRAFKQVATIVHAAERMEHLISDLLDLAQLEAGGLAIRRKAVDGAALINDSLEIFRPAAAAKKLHLESESTPGIAALADRDRVLQIMSNLIGNAIKFTPEGGWILVRVARSDGEAQFTVSDTGPGIAPEDLPRIWGRFWQSRRDSGIGLGLTIAKAIVEAHGGRIWAETHPGSGTTFHFTLPLAADDAERARAPVADP